MATASIRRPWPLQSLSALEVFSETIQQLQLLAFATSEHLFEKVAVSNLVVHREAVEKLNSNLEAIQVVLNDAGWSGWFDPHKSGSWVEKLLNISNGMDDVLDEWNTIIAKLQIKESENVSNPLRKVCSLISYNPCYCSRVVRSYDIALKIKELNRKIYDIDMRIRRVFCSPIRDTENLGQPVTNSYIDLSEFYGRNQEKNTLVNLLLSESSREANPSVISIVGMGGIGKTYLSQLVFNDDKVKAHFDRQIWLHVSNSFNEIRIAKEILKALNQVVPSRVELVTMLQQICQFVKGKKILLVLDNVWIEDAKSWEQIKNSLKCSRQGSRVLLTTRKVNTAEVMETANTIKLGLLSDEECWSLFFQTALQVRKKEEFEKLEYIGRKIVGKCKGLPLAVNILGNLLCSKNNIEEWERVLDSKLWKLDVIEKKLFQPLLLSYYDLPFLLRKCFLYCAIFPKGYEINKDKLIKLWMAQGYLHIERREDMELVGEEYFEKLAMCSFFQDFERSEYDGSIISWKMHDIVHDFVQFFVKHICFTSKFLHNVKPRSQYYDNRTSHSMIIFERGSFSMEDLFNATRLHSLVVECKGDFDFDIPLSKIFDRLRCLRTLDLHCSEAHSFHSIKKIPRGIRKLIHLRYLNLSQNFRIRELPETLCDLYNLQTLDLSYCGNLLKLPQRIGKLINLRHLINIGTHLSYMPKGMERLTCLRTLSTFTTRSGGRDSKLHTLECLKNLNFLEGSLSLIGLGNVIDAGEAELAKLKSKENLLSLRLRFDNKKEVKGRACLNNDEDVLEALQPPSCLKELKIEEYKGKCVFPHWMFSLTMLRQLTLDYCINCEHLPPLGKLSSLESLTIKNMERVKSVGNEFLGIERDDTGTSIIVFPELKTLTFQNMNQWEDWDIMMGDENITIMPRLRSLTIQLCYKLKALPDYLLQIRTLDKLNIISCSILKEPYEMEIAELWPKISHISSTCVFPDLVGDKKSSTSSAEMESLSQHEYSIFSQKKDFRRTV